MAHPRETTDAPATIVTLSTVTIGCFGLTAPFSGFHAAPGGPGEPLRRDLRAAAAAFRRAVAGLVWRGA